MDVIKEKKDPKYTKSYSGTRLFEKILKFSKVVGIRIVYTALILFYTLQKATTPKWAKSMIIGALAYFILPIDFIPDFIPFIGYTDDFSALAGVLVAVSMYADEEVKQKSKEKLNVWFSTIDDAELKKIDAKIDKSVN
ncbi:MAG: YkvA family protein [Erysipelotrichaceae bacterium]|nr:YkvA family protein [Erysipelotrichaceae bacterium]MDP3305107.1 YkvA family protein [Erysipelotrichaceae bacterium]